MNLNDQDAGFQSETFGQDASFHLEQPIGSMSISPSGRDVVLASKEGLHIIDLDSPYSPPRHLPHRTPWEVADVQWSPFAVRDYWIVSTSNQKALVWNVGNHGWSDAIEYVLHGHSRAITDINFSAHHPDMLATCAVDSFVHGWDLRSPSRPSFSFSDWFAGATQVKFSRRDEHVIASSHDRFLHIWDKRKGAYPTKTIEAHGTKIYGIDWNRFETNKIVTCSLDKTIKFWDVSDASGQPERVIETGFPVWRARHTPFGWGLLAMPQRDVSDLHLYDRRAIDGTMPSGHVRPVTTFPGHKGKVKEFLWRYQGNIHDNIDCRDFQLVTWGADRELRLHHVPEDVFHAIGYERGVSRAQRISLTRRGARYRTFRDAISEPYSPSETVARTDSFPAQGHFLGFRNRQSTNVGMSKVPISQFRGWLQGNRRERRTGMHGKASTRQDMNPIAWMKNVKIASWDPDSLADEITQVGEKFKKVEFESIEINQRKAIMSLQGPWGENNSMAYMRADLRFPKAYPRAANAIITLQKSNSINLGVHRMLATEVHTIAETYASRQRGCLEAVVRYLLHEQSMEQIVSWLLDETTTDSKILEPSEMPDELSSDSDDENLNGTADPSNSSANIRVPLAKGCGAMWANDGRLVCFFLKASSTEASLMAKLGGPDPDDSLSNKLFERFGRLQTDSPTRKPVSATYNDNDEADEDSDDIASTFSRSSSSSSSASEADGMIRDGFGPYQRGISLGLPQRSRSDERSNKSTTIDGTKLESDNRLNNISIHDDLHDLIPARKSLAEQYRISGNRTEACAHNADVAASCGLSVIASIWQLVGLVLERRVPLHVIRPLNRVDDDNIVLIAQRSSLSLRRKDSGVFIGTNIDAESKNKHNPTGSIRWGNSPLAGAYLVSAMFNYFEKIADIQTLATLSCILLQHDNSFSFSQTRKSAEAPGLPIHYTQPYYPSVDVAISLLYGADPRRNNIPTLKSSIRQGRQLLTDPPEPVPNQRRQFLNTDASGHKHNRSQLFRKESSTISNTSMSNTHVMHEKAISIGTSPEETRFFQRAEPPLPYPVSHASLNAIAQTYYSRSPPSGGSTAASSLKKPSPSTSLSASHWSGNLFGRDLGGRVASKPSTRQNDLLPDESSRSFMRSSVSSVSLREAKRDDNRMVENSRGSVNSSKVDNDPKAKRANSNKKRTVRTTLHNQSQFDLDGYADQPLISPTSFWKHRSYRTAYAEMLGTWGLWLQRAEILHSNTLLSPNSRPLDHRRASIANLIQLPHGLEAARCCHECGKPFVPVHKNGLIISWHCISNECLLSTRRVSKSQICNVCQKVVRGLFIPCLRCRHITCYDCAQEWFGKSQPTALPPHRTSSSAQSSGEEPDALRDEQYDRGCSSDLEQTCPSGCGCVCTTNTSFDVQWPMEPESENDTLQSRDLIPSVSVRRLSTSTTPTGSASKTEPSLDTALGAMMSLSSKTRAPPKAAVLGRASISSTSIHEESQSLEDELMPWANGRFTSLGRGIGGGLSRGLSNRSSDATIRKV